MSNSTEGNAALLPCPFCGGDELFRTADNFNATDRINCKGCMANTVLWKRNTRQPAASSAALVEAVGAETAPDIEHEYWQGWNAAIKRCVKHIRQHAQPVADEQGVDEAIIERMVVAFNREKSAQQGEPFPLDLWKKYKRDFPEEFAEEMGQMRCALAAIRQGCSHE